MKLTPQDIHHKEFKRGIRGYSEEEVDVFLDQLAEQFELLYKQNATNEEEIQKLKEKLTTYQNMELTLQNTLLTAQKSAEEVQSNAQKEADGVLNNAKKQAKSTLTTVEKQRQVLSETFAKLKSLETSYKTKIRENMKSFLSKLDSIEGNEADLLQELESAFEKVPEIEIPKVTAEGSHPEEATGSSRPVRAQDKLPDLTKATETATTEAEEEEDPTQKADASKSDIASEEEIDKFLQQEHPEIGNEEMPNEEKAGLLGRIFKKKEVAEEDVDSNGNGEVAAQKVQEIQKSPEEKPVKKAKKKKSKQQNTQEIKV